ncbi:hypothetical protein Bbelb_149780 [Branchiostoma belcheri]|nr:hypothetical protein Bbelb_149780 [Branchiostoma belcheri]
MEDDSSQSRRAEQDMFETSRLFEDVENLSIENNNNLCQEQECLPSSSSMPTCDFQNESEDVELVVNNNDTTEDVTLTSRLDRDKHHQEHWTHKESKTAWMKPKDEDGNCNVINQDIAESSGKDSSIPVCNDDQRARILQQSHPSSSSASDTYTYNSVKSKWKGDGIDLGESQDTHVGLAADDSEIPGCTRDINSQDTGQSCQTDLRKSESCQPRLDHEGSSEGQVSHEDGSQGQADAAISEESLLESAAMLQSHVVMLEDPAHLEGAICLEGGEVHQSTEMFRNIFLTQVQQQLEDLDRELKTHLSKSERCLMLHRDKMSSYMQQAETFFSSEDAGDSEGAARGQQEKDWQEPLHEGHGLSLKDILDSDSEDSQQGDLEGADSPAAGGYWREELVFANKIQELEMAVEERVTAVRPPEDIDEEAEDGTRFGDLPAELVVRIFSYLTLQELCESAAPVCRAWYRHAHDPLLWQELDLDFNHDVRAVDLCAMIRGAPLLKVLVMRGRNELTITEVSVFVKYCSMLQQLDMGFCKVLDLTMLHIIVDSCPQLELVNVEGCDSIRDSCLTVLSRLPKLTVLNLSHCTSVTDDGVCHLVRHCPGLTSLNIDGIAWITDNAVQDIAACYPSMRQLYLDGDELTNASITAVTDSCAQLELLDISFCEGVTDHSVQNIPKLQHLKHLRLKRGVQLSSAVMLHLFRGEALAGLTYLNLTECTAVNNGVVERISKCCAELRELYLCWCWDITEEGLEHIVNNLSKLHHLDLTGLDKISGACLTHVPSTLPHLTYLDLQQCNRVQDEVLSALVSAEPGLTIVDYYGNNVPDLPEQCRS